MSDLPIPTGQTSPIVIRPYEYVASKSISIERSGFFQIPGTEVPANARYSSNIPWATAPALSSGKALFHGFMQERSFIYEKGTPLPWQEFL